MKFYATIGIVILDIGIFLWEMQAQKFGLWGNIIQDFSFHWERFLVNPLMESPTLVTHLFFHADLAHVISNMIFFLLFARAVEKIMGPVLFLVCYLSWGIFAGLINGYFSPFVSLLGASGAISGVAGAYIVFNPIKKSIKTFVPFIFIGFWFLVNLKMGFIQMEYGGLEENAAGQVGYLAHIGGFLMGSLTGFLLILRNASKNRHEY